MRQRSIRSRSRNRLISKSHKLLLLHSKLFDAPCRFPFRDIITRIKFVFKPSKKLNLYSVKGPIKKTNCHQKTYESYCITNVSVPQTFQFSLILDSHHRLRSIRCDRIPEMRQHQRNGIRSRWWDQQLDAKKRPSIPQS